MNNRISPEEYRWRNRMGITVAAMLSTGEVPDNFSMGIEPPEKGWLRVHLDFGSGGRFVCRASDQPNDFMRDLTEAMRRSAEGEPVDAVMHAEPDAFVLQFEPTEPDGLRIRLVHQESFERTGQASTIVEIETDDRLTFVGSIAWMLRDFADGITDEMYFAGYHHPLPREAIGALPSLPTQEHRPDSNGGECP